MFSIFYISTPLLSLDRILEESMYVCVSEERMCMHMYAQVCTMRLHVYQCTRTSSP